MVCLLFLMNSRLGTDLHKRRIYVGNKFIVGLFWVNVDYVWGVGRDQ
jgi:hypothetical protein